MAIQTQICKLFVGPGAHYEILKTYNNDNLNRAIREAQDIKIDKLSRTYLTVRQLQFGRVIYHEFVN